MRQDSSSTKNTDNKPWELTKFPSSNDLNNKSEIYGSSFPLKKRPLINTQRPQQLKAKITVTPPTPKPEEGEGNLDALF